MATTARQQYFADGSSLSKEKREFSIADGIQEKIDSVEEWAQVNKIEAIKVNWTAVVPDVNKTVNLAIPRVEDSLSSISTIDALSARQWKVLYDYIQDVSHIWHFLALWDASTWLPVTNPEVSPYIYNTWDFYTVSNVAPSWGTNYKPDGTQYVIWQASTTVDTDDVEVNDFYFYDGSTWRHMKNSWAGSIAIDGSLSTTSTNPVENRVVTNAINWKQNTLIAWTNIQIASDWKTISATDTKYTAGTGINIDANNVISNTQTSAEWWNITWTLSSQTDLQNALDAKQDDMVILKYGISTWNDFITAYNKNWVVYCRASSNSNPASWSQTRLAFMAYVNDETAPTEVEFQYYRSRSSHSTAATVLDEVYVYKLTSGWTWTVTQRDTAAEPIAWTWIWLTYNASGMTISADTTVLATKTDLNSKQDVLTAGTGISIASNTVSTASNFWKSTTAAATAQKEVSIPWIKELHEGQVVHILPSVTSSVANSTLKVNNFTAYPMRYNNAAITTSTDSIVRPANIVTTFVFDWTYWQFVWHGLDSNTTYSNMSATEANTWTATSARTISASVLKWAVETHAPVQSVNWQTWAVTLNADNISDTGTTNKFVTQTDKDTWDWKQDELESWVNIRTINWTSILWSWDITTPVWPTYTAGSNVQISAENVISATDTTYTAMSQSEAASWITATPHTISASILRWAIRIHSKVQSVNWNEWAVTVSEFTPWWTATTGYVVTKTASGYEWQAPSGWIEVDANSPIQLTKIWAWTQAQYDALSSYDATTVYLTI